MKNLYYCKHCHKTIKRDDDKKHILSYCTKLGKITRLVRIKK